MHVIKMAVLESLIDFNLSNRKIYSISFYISKIVPIDEKLISPISSSNTLFFFISLAFFRSNSVCL